MRNIESLFSSDDGSTEYDNRKRFWRFIKHNRTDSTGITELKTADGTTVSDAIPKAEALNQQFKSAFTQETEIKDDILPDILPFEEMPEVTFTTNGIEKLLHGLKTHKAAGPDGITPRILKHLAKTLAPILCNIFRLSYDRGEIPDDWREANVVPIYKKGRQIHSSKLSTHLADMYLLQTNGTRSRQQYYEIRRQKQHHLSPSVWLSKEHVM